jgi:hypothetical protein
MPLTFAKCGSVGGDVEPIAVLQLLARRHPEDIFILIGRNSGDTAAEAGLPSNVWNPWPAGWKQDLDSRVRAAGLKGESLTIDNQLKLMKIFDEITGSTIHVLDGFIQWVGQHGTSNSPIPRIGDLDNLTKPQEWSAWYAGWMFRGLNRWRDVDPWNREEIYLNPDPRNYHKMRDIKWPLRHPILAQFNDIHNIKHCRYGDTRAPVGWEEYAHTVDRDTWGSRTVNMYSRLEICGTIPGTPFGDTLTFDTNWEDRAPFGLFINETRRIGVHPTRSRLTAMRDYVLPLNPHFIHGTWSEASQKELDLFINPWPQMKYNEKIHEVRCTFTTPSSGHGWATAKPWEAFAAGVVCFFHPDYDTQDNILGDAPPELKKALRVSSPLELRTKVEYLSYDPGMWRALINMQREHWEKAVRELRFIELIEERIWQ